MRTEWSAVYGETHLRLISQGNGVIRVTRDLTGAFRGCGVSAVCAKPEGTWKRSSDEKGEIFTLPGFSVRAGREDGALTFLREDGSVLLREQPGKPAELAPAEIVINEFDSGACVTETSSVDGARASAAPARRTKRASGGGSPQKSGSSIR